MSLARSRAPGGALLVHEEPPVEGALKRAQAPAPAQGPRGTLIWECGGSPERAPVKERFQKKAQNLVI